MASDEIIREVYKVLEERRDNPYHHTAGFTDHPWISR